MNLSRIWRGRPLEYAVPAIKNELAPLMRRLPETSLLAVLLVALLIDVATESAALMAGVTLVVVTLSAVLLFHRRNNVGEAAVALSAGLVAALLVTWTPARFGAFLVMWVFFALSVLVIGRVQTSILLDHVYSDATSAIARTPGEYSAIKERLKTTAHELSSARQTDPHETANILRVFAYRGVGLDMLAEAYQLAENVSIASSLNLKGSALFVCDLWQTLRLIGGDNKKELLSRFAEHIRRGEVSPSDFFEAFRASRGIAILKGLSPTRYFDQLLEGAEIGRTAADITQSILESATLPGTGVAPAKTADEAQPSSCDELAAVTAASTSNVA